MLRDSSDLALTRLLLDSGHSVVGLDHVNSADHLWLKEWRLSQLTGLRNFQNYWADLTDFEAHEKIFAESARVRPNDPSFDAVFNLAARAGVQPSVVDPWVYLRSNAEGTLNMLEQCRRHGVQKFVLASTSSLYGPHNTDAIFRRC